MLCIPFASVVEQFPGKMCLILTIANPRVWFLNSYLAHHRLADFRGITIDTDNILQGLCGSPVAQAALQLQQEENPALGVDLPAGQVLTPGELLDGARLADNVLTFDSVAARNQILAQSVYEAIRPTVCNEPDQLFVIGAKLWRHEIGHHDQASGRLLALASHDLDVIAAAAQRIRSGARAFDVLHLLEAAFPYLDHISVASIIDLCLAKYDQTKNDMMAGVFHGVLETWLKTKPTIAKQLHADVCGQVNEITAALLGNAVCAIAQTDFCVAVDLAKADARSGEALRASVGAWTLGRLLLDEQLPSTLAQELIAELTTLMSSEVGELRTQAIRAATGAMHKMSAFDVLLQRLAESGDHEVLCAAASSLCYRAEEMRDRGIGERWFELLTALKPEFTSAVSELDHALAQKLAAPDNTEFVINVLTQWVAKHGETAAIGSNTVELFGSVIRALFARADAAARLLTTWLLSDELKHPAALAGILSQLSDTSDSKLVFDADDVDQLAGEDLMFLARRLLGFVHDRAQMTSLALSLLASKDAKARIHPIVRALLVDEIGYDYPSSTLTTLRQYTSDSDYEHHRTFLLEMAAAIDHSLQVENSLAVRNELRPPAKLHRLFARARSKQMNRSFEEARKKSVFRQIATEIPIKAGNWMFNYRNSDYGASTKLESISHSIELPRREVFDPIGNAIRHLHFRIAKRSQS